MPIRREFRHFYTSKSWKETRARILARAGGVFDADGKYLGGAKCEKCQAPDRTVIARFKRFPGWWSTIDGYVYSEDGNPQGQFRGSELPEPTFIRVQIGIAHLKFIPRIGESDNDLAALCARDHLLHDKSQHKDSRSLRKDLARPLLVEACG